MGKKDTRAGEQLVRVVVLELQGWRCGGGLLWLCLWGQNSREIADGLLGILN